MADPFTFRILLRDHAPGFGPPRPLLMAQLAWLASQVCRAPNHFRDALVEFLPAPAAPGALAAHEPVVHLLRDRMASLVHRRVPDQFRGVDGDTLGLTAIGAGTTLSEVYLAQEWHAEPLALAMSILHEAMHAKLQMGEAMHGLAAHRGGLLADNTPPLTAQQRRRRLALPFTATDIAMLAPALPAPLDQVSGL